MDGKLKGEKEGKHISAHTGFWTIRMKVNKKGVTEIEPKFYPAYD